MASEHLSLGRLILFGSIIAAAMPSRNASAVFTGLTAERHTTVNINGNAHDVWRLYANFSTATERVIAVFGSPTMGPMSIESRNGSDTGPGGAFYNNPLGNSLVPSQDIIDLDGNAQWDSFYTFGISVAEQSPYGNVMLLTPGFPAPSGTSISTGNGAWSIIQTIDHDNDRNTPDVVNPQGVSGFAGDGDPLNRVLVAQLTTPAGGNIRGTVNLQLASTLGSGSVYELAGQTFNSIPASGALPALVIFGFSRGARRRCGRH